ncbi:MAG: ketoacyl-ACP synthase III [Thermofilaceae archaeon]
MRKPEIKKYARIVSTGISLGRTLVTNEEYEKYFGLKLPDAWRSALENRIGIRHRYVASPDQAPSDLAAEAAKMALQKAGLTIDDIDLVIVATDTPDFQTPPTVSSVHYKLGAKLKTGGFDINAACADNTIALILASQSIMLNEDVNYALVVSPYTMVRFTDPQDVTASIFSDGAGAVILGPSDEPGFITGKIIADGSYYDYWGIYIGGARPVSEEVVREKWHKLRYLKRYPPDINLRHWPGLVQETLKKAGLTADDISYYFVTQVNREMVRELMRILGQPVEKAPTIMDKYGYTGSACVFMALHDTIEQGKLRKGDYLQFVTSGVGFVMASAIFRWV